MFILHARPKQIAGRTFGLRGARDHRLHHQDLRDLPLIFIPFRWVGYLIASVLLGGLLIPAWPMRTSFYVAAFAMAVTSTWSHFLSTPTTSRRPACTGTWLRQPPVAPLPLQPASLVRHHIHGGRPGPAHTSRADDVCAEAAKNLLGRGSAPLRQSAVDRIGSCHRR